MSSKEDRPRTVPKFGSFKPKAPVKVAPEELSRTETLKPTVEGESRDVKRHKSRHRDRDGDGDRNHRRSQHESRSERHPGRHSENNSDRFPLPGPKTTAPAREPKNIVDELFTIDKRGDPLIVRYRGNDRSRVPAYRRIRRGIVLGSSGYLEILQDGPREEFSIRTTREGRSAFRDKNLLAQAGKTKSRLFKNSTQQPPPTVDQDFIALEPARKRKRGDDGDGDSSSDREGKSYRSIEGKAKVHLDSDSAFESDSDDAEAEGYYVTPAKRRAIELSRTVKERPDDIEAWLELIGLQDVLFRENEEDDHVRTRDETKALADIKVSMFEKALPHAMSTTDREKLLVHLMREGSRVWKYDKLAKRWADVTEQNPDSFALWKSRMDFELSNISTFSFDDTKQRFVDRLRFIEEKLLRETDDEIGQRDLAEQAIYVFLRLTRFLHEAGFLDLAVGAWQAMLELLFARATLLEDNRESAIASLGEFWDSEVPRIGETGAMGWRKFVDDGSIGDLPETKHEGPRRRPETRDLYEAWAAAESRQALEARTPAKTVDEGTEDDPYRVVMFADIEPFLVFFPSALLRRVQKPLLDAYLLFCHLPPGFCPDSSILQSATSDPFVYGGSKDFEQTTGRPTQSIDVASERKRQPPNFKQDGSHIAISPDVLFSGGSWFNYLASWRELYPRHDEAVERSYILTTLRQLVRTFGFHELAEYHLALEWLNEPSGAKKVAKAVLKQYPSHVGLYNAYALIECGNGNLETAHKVLQSATGQGLSSGATRQMLQNTWAWIELEATQLTKALARLCFGEPARSTAITPALILKARSELSSQRDSFLSAGSPGNASHFAVSLALLSYLSTSAGDASGKEPQSADQGNITVAMAVCNAFSAELISRGLAQSPVHERFLQFAARLVYYHATHGPFRPVYIREQLQRFVMLFPQNTIFLSVFAWAESSLRIDDPVKALLRDTALTESHDSVSSRLFAIRYELQVGNVHSVKSAFESAVESEACRGNSWLWLYYIRFCNSRQELRSRAKDVFYRAIAACPGSKKLYMEAFGTLRREMTESQLEAVMSTIISKGLRVHVDFDSFAKEWQGRSER
ncbi:DUF1740-domain-containing protein [Coniochaeta ligniaria NRRL 30616]|uniref:DUF1740-domain-containing protein n=1 Tax=Coniochaeta ligniaria NRRL 30616 TaxID=1408157 RepID=A0A1J7J1P1_9PEZI|nr:DUF1740-domain-containing protein [Coniochaeta ligniaria NRRL 30616]